MRREGAGGEAERAALLARAAAVIPTSGFHRSRQADFINVAAGAWFMRLQCFTGLIGPYGVKSQSTRTATNIEREDNMVRALVLSAALAFGLASAANAAMAPAPVVGADPAIVKVAEDCGANRWRDEYGHCHWFHNQYGNMRGTHEACPTWAHWFAGRCVPN